MMQPKTAILIGAGARGARAYAPYALANPHELNIIAVAESNKDRREKLQKDHNIPLVNCFSSCIAILDHNQNADIAIICTQDRHKYVPTMKALSLGYHVLLEKPKSPDPKECI